MDVNAIAVNPEVANLTDELNESADLKNPVQKTEVLDQSVLTECTDFELTQLASKGNLDAFEMLYHKHHRRAYSLCLKMTNNATEAEDLTQEVFTQLFRKVGSFRGDSAFTTWFHRMTVNQVLMHFRKRSVKNEKTTEDGEMPEYAIKHSRTRSSKRITNRLDITNAVKQLPPGYKSVFLLHDVEGFEHAEVARRLGISVGTSKSQLHKARLKLRGILTATK